MVPNVEVIEMPAPEPAARGRGRRGAAPVGTAGAADPQVTIYVTKATSALTVEDASGKVLFHAPVTSGSEHDPLPIGAVEGHRRSSAMPTFNYNPDLFWDADPTHSKAQDSAGPNNPVGMVWIDLTKEHYGIHGTPEPSQHRPHAVARLRAADELGRAAGRAAGRSRARRSSSDETIRAAPRRSAAAHRDRRSA